MQKQYQNTDGARCSVRDVYTVGQALLKPLTVAGEREGKPEGAITMESMRAGLLKGKSQLK